MTGNKARVTIVIPTYNRAGYLRETILSALNQSYRDVQVMVLDDASTDATQEIEQEFSDEPRLTWLRHSHNLGMVANWKAGIERVTSEYFCLLNDDDTLHPAFVETLIAPLENDPNLILAFCDHWVVNEAGLRQPDATERCTGLHHRDCLPTGIVEHFAEAVVLYRSLHISCSLMRTRMVPAKFIDVRAGGFACGWLFYECFRTGFSAYYVSSRLVNYRVHSGNMVGNPKWQAYMNDGHIFWCRTMVSDPLLACIRPELYSQVSSILASYGTGLLASGENSRAIELFAESFVLHKSFKPLIGYALSHLGGVGAWIVSIFRKITPRSMFHAITPIGDVLIITMGYDQLTKYVSLG